MCFGRSSRLAAALLAALIATLATGNALATVSLTLTDGDGAPQFAAVPIGGMFTVQLRLKATTEQTTGLDYYLYVQQAAGSGKFTIVTRSYASSAYPDPAHTDAEIGIPGFAIPLRTAYDQPTLDPSIVTLGSSVATPSNPLPASGAADYLVATYTIQVGNATPTQNYTIGTISYPDNNGWVGTGPFYPQQAFNSHASFTVFVPEPMSGGLLAAGMLALACRRPRRPR